MGMHFNKYDEENHDVVSESSNIQSFITIGQALIGFVGVIVTCSFFIFSIKANVDTHSRDIKRLDAWTIEHKMETKEEENKRDALLKEILDKVEAIQLTLKDKQDKQK